ncbi:FKBP-type peptidyl-prolyl cis-trans isomerase [Bowmanella dokdonensis]|uniref:Peptidyl-prolyl cis-trans isomerase n=1 Tax=Bowmanella dokdonensis TaxID=751969 RepID=A0A939DSF0_9ALTE|nr:FKBP-type peptidyl-prolyl cis-trans isomerase [Bowmanella dokdonensis]MBN7827091.1 FKBP-type peptidyl-prolyl cis-trans isomerase [Bowmanella dokdonensis]
MADKLINDGSEVILHFDLKLEDGSAADSTRVNNKPARLKIGDGSLTSNFEACLLGMKEGERRAFTLGPEDAFGQPNPDNIHHMDRSRFSAEATPKPGMIIAFSQPGGAEIPGIVRDVQGESVTVDFNHPLAGHRVIFDVEIIKIND